MLKIEQISDRIIVGLGHLAKSIKTGHIPDLRMGDKKTGLLASVLCEEHKQRRRPVLVNGKISSILGRYSCGAPFATHSRSASSSSSST